MVGSRLTSRNRIESSSLTFGHTLANPDNLQTMATTRLLPALLARSGQRESLLLIRACHVPPGSCRLGFRRVLHQSRFHDKALRRMAGEVERITGHQGERRCRTRLQDLHIRRRDNFYALHAIGCRLVVGRDLDRVAHLNVFEPPEESIAVAGDADIAAFSGKGSARDASNPAIERHVIDAIKQRSEQMKPRYAEFGHRFGKWQSESLAVGFYPDIRPVGKVYSGCVFRGVLRRRRPS